MEAREFYTEETVMAVLPDMDTPSAGPQEVEAIQTEIIQITSKAGVITILDDNQYSAAAEIGRDIKRKQQAVIDLFAPIKKAANDAHKAACAQEKRMLDPLKDAAKAITDEMSRYDAQVEAKRQADREEAERAAREEADKLLARAISLESTGQTDQAAVLFQNAQVIETASGAVTAGIQAQKVEGVTKRTDYEIEVQDAAKVPVSFMGAMIRPVDEAAIMRLVRATKGAIEIPGIIVREVKKTTLRR